MNLSTPYVILFASTCECTQSAVVTQNNGWIITPEHTGKLFVFGKLGL